MCSNVSLGLICRQHPLGVQVPTPQTCLGFHYSPLRLPENCRHCLQVPKFIASWSSESRKGPFAWQGEQAELQTTVFLRIPSKSTIHGILLPPQPVRCSVGGGLRWPALTVKFISQPTPSIVPAPATSFIFFGRPVRDPLFKHRPC